MTNELKMKTKKKKVVSLDKLKARSGWIFVLPFVIGFILIYFPIVYRSLIMSFQHIEIASGKITATWVGFDNYANALFTDPNFVKTLVSGFQQMIFEIPAIIIFSLFMAVLLNQKMVGRAVFRAIFFVPVILSTGLMETINMSTTSLSNYMSEGISDDSGTSTTDQIVSSLDIERLFSGMKIGTELVEFVANWVNNIFNIVNRSGVQMLIFLAGLQSISPTIYESCQMDGATAWETFWKITFPMISPMILVNAVYTVIDAFTTESNTVMAFINDVDDRALSSSMAWFYFIIVIAIVAAVAGICSAFVFYQRRND